MRASARKHVWLSVPAGWSQFMKQGNLETRSKIEYGENHEGTFGCRFE
jgi:hypothetical protein